LLLEIQELPSLAAEWAGMLHDACPAAEAEVLQSAADALRLSARLPGCRTAIFEGSQGVLLDEWKGLHPYTTWSTVTPYHALEMIEEHGPAEITILGVTRAYATRHGAGPFPTWRPGLSAQLTDRGNPTNDWQGSIRFGALDLVLLEYAARVCRIDALVVNCLDHVSDGPLVCTGYADLSRIEIPTSLREQEKLTALLQSVRPDVRKTTSDELLDMLGRIAPVDVTANGPTHRDRRTYSRRLADRAGAKPKQDKQERTHASSGLRA
jgi:adenylosuccinate synthase